MSPEAIIAILQLVSALTPEAIKLANNIHAALSDQPEADRMAAIKAMSASLQPMAPKL